MSARFARSSRSAGRRPAHPDAAQASVAPMSAPRACCSSPSASVVRPRLTLGSSYRAGIFIEIPASMRGFLQTGARHVARRAGFAARDRQPVLGRGNGHRLTGRDLRYGLRRASIACDGDRILLAPSILPCSSSAQTTALDETAIGVFSAIRLAFLVGDRRRSAHHMLSGRAAVGVGRARLSDHSGEVASAPQEMTGGRDPPPLPGPVFRRDRAHGLPRGIVPLSGGRDFRATSLSFACEAPRPPRSLS